MFNKLCALHIHFFSFFLFLFFFFSFFFSFFFFFFSFFLFLFFFFSFFFSFFFFFFFFLLDLTYSALPLGHSFFNRHTPSMARIQQRDFLNGMEYHRVVESLLKSDQVLLFFLSPSDTVKTARSFIEFTARGSKKEFVETKMKNTQQQHSNAMEIPSSSSSSPSQSSDQKGK